MTHPSLTTLPSAELSTSSLRVAISCSLPMLVSSGAGGLPVDGRAGLPTDDSACDSLAVRSASWDTAYGRPYPNQFRFVCLIRK